MKTQVFFAAVGLRGVKTDRDGVGVRVKVVAGDLTLHDEVHGGQGYQSSYGINPNQQLVWKLDVTFALILKKRKFDDRRFGNNLHKNSDPKF